MLAGDYILKVVPLWMTESQYYPTLKRLRIGLSAHVPITMESIYPGEARNKLTERNSRGKAKLVAQGKICKVLSSSSLGKNLSLERAADLARGIGAKRFMYSPIM